MILQARNDSQSDISLDIGVTVNPAQLYPISQIKWPYWADSDDVDTYLDSGDLVIVLDGVDLTPVQAKYVIHKMTIPPTALNASGTEALIPNSIKFDGDISFTKDANENVTVIVDGLARHKRNDSIMLIKNAGASDTWLHWGANVISELTSWTPPYNCKVTKVIASNKKYGSTSNPLVTRVEARSITFNSDDNIDDGDQLDWYVDSDGPNATTHPKGRIWTYDNSSENDLMVTTRQYAFRYLKTDGNGNPNDAMVQIFFEEL